MSYLIFVLLRSVFAKPREHELFYLLEVTTMDFYSVKEAVPQNVVFKSFWYDDTFPRMTMTPMIFSSFQAVLALGCRLRVLPFSHSGALFVFFRECSDSRTHPSPSKQEKKNIN